MTKPIDQQAKTDDTGTYSTRLSPNTSKNSANQINQSQPSSFSIWKTAEILENGKAHPAYSANKNYL